MKSPFKFLDSYSKEDRSIFFGRERETEELYRKVFENKVLLVYGVSGTGKTSLINCGLANKFEESDWMPVNIRRGSGILESLWQQLDIAEQLGAKSTDTFPGHDEKLTGKILKKLNSVYLEHFKPVYLVFDQFEELFIFGSRNERDEFLKVIEAIVRSDIKCKILFSIREEYLASITEFERVIPEIMQNRMRVEKMDHSNALKVITGPCEIYGISLEHDFENRLLDLLAPEGKEVELTYLQVYLDKVFREATQSLPADEKNVVLTNEILKQLGNVGDLLGSFLEEQVGLLEDPELGLTVLKSFVSVKGTKRQITIDEVSEACKTFGKKVDDDSLKHLLNKFVDLRILRDKDENGRYELRHDSLAAKIFEKITLVEKEVMEVRTFIEHARDTYQSRGTMLSKEDLAYISTYEDRLFLSKELQGFVEKCRSSMDARQRSFKITIAISITGVVLMFLAMGVYIYQKFSERDNEREYLYFAASMNISEEQNFKLAYDYYLRDSLNGLSRKSVFDAFYWLVGENSEIWKPIIYNHPGNTDIMHLDLSADGNLLYGWSQRSEIIFWDMFGEEKGKLNVPGDIQRLDLSHDNKVIAALLEGDSVFVSAVDGSFSFMAPTTSNPVNNKYLVSTSDRDEFVAAIVYGNDAKLYRKDGTVFQTLSHHTMQLNALDLSPDNRFLALASDDSTFSIWYFGEQKKKFDLLNTNNRHEGAVRSCQFNSRSNYIVTSSDDANTVIWNFNGSGRIFSSTYRNVMPFPYFAGYYSDSLVGKECDAYFMSGDRTMVITVDHSETIDGVYHKKHLKYISNDESSAFSPYQRNRYLYNPFEALNQEDLLYLEELVPSPDTRSVAFRISGNNGVCLIHHDHLILKVFPGTNAVFSKDSKYLFSTSGSKITKYPVSAEEMRSILKERIIN